jgi:hypothetical protein
MGEIDLRSPLDRQIEALRDLVNSDGFGMLCAEAKRQYGPQARDRAIRAVMNAKTPIDDEMKRIYWASEAIEQLLLWPEQEAKRIAAATVLAEVEAETVGRRA